MHNSSERTIGNTNECDLGGYEYFVRDGNNSRQQKTNLTPNPSTGKRVAYQTNDKAAFERYVSILDTIQEN